MKPLLCRAGYSYSANFRRRQMIKGLFRRSKRSSGIRIALLTNFAFLNWSMIQAIMINSWSCLSFERLHTFQVLLVTLLWGWWLRRFTKWSLIPAHLKLLQILTLLLTMHPFSQRWLNCAAQIVNYQAYCPLLDHHAVLLFWCLGLVVSTDLEKCLILLLEQVVPTDDRLYELKLLPSESPVQLVKLLRYLESQLFQTVASVWGLSFGFSNERYHLHEFISAFTFGRDRCFLRLKFMTWIWLSCLSIHFVLATSCWWWKAGGGSSYSLLQPLLRFQGRSFTRHFSKIVSQTFKLVWRMLLLARLRKGFMPL